MKIIDNTPIEDLSVDWGDPDGTGTKAKSLEQVQAFIKNKFLGLGYTYIDTATPSTTPITLAGDKKVFYIATEEGEYTKFGITTPISELAIIKNIGTTWKAYELGVGSSLTNIASRGIFVHKDHLVNIEDGTYTYMKSTNWSCLWIPTPPQASKLFIKGFDFSNVTKRFFSGYEITTDNHLINTYEDVIPEGAVVCLLNVKKEIVSDFSNVYVEYEFKKTNLATNVEGLIVLKNLIDINDLLYGYLLSEGQIISNSRGVMSNKIKFIDGETYAFQNILHYGTAHKIFICHFDEFDNFLGSTSVAAEYEEDSSIGRGIYTYNQSARPATSYCRVVMRTYQTDIDFSLCQIELGAQYTEVVGFMEKYKVIYPKSSVKKKIRLLSIGNSYSQDALSYVPFILKNMGIDADIQIGILMQSSSPLSWHVDNFNNKAEVYYYYHCTSGSWQSLGMKSIQWALDSYEWDIVILQQSSQAAFSWEKYQPYCNQLISLVSHYVKYPIKFMWYQPMARPASVNSGANWSDEVITEHYESTAIASKRLMEEALLEIIVPVGTAIQNARTIPELKAIGDYAQNESNTSGLGYLTPNDGVHLQEGLPCLIAAYTFVRVILDTYGFNNFSILGEQTRPTAEWAEGKNIPAPHGQSVGVTQENCITAQKCAIMAVKHPYTVTDMNAL